MKDARLSRCFAVVAIVFAAPSEGKAAEYGGEVIADGADELAALAAAGELDADALDTLQALLDMPPDQSRASVEEVALQPGVSRAQARRRAELRTGAESVEVAALRFDAELLQHAHVQTQGALRLRVAPTPWWSAGGLLIMRDRTRVAMSGGRLVSDGPRREVGLERWYGIGQLGPFRLIVGSFNCDFAESLTFSSARRIYAPTLATSDDVARAVDAQSLRAVPALRGLALQLEVGALEATAFASYRALDLYQYAEWLHDGGSPTILQRGSGEPLRYATIAGAARETVAGGNMDVRFGEQVVGLTAYAGMARLVDPAGSWNSSSLYPSSPGFGAVGGHVVAQLGLLRARGEFARTLVAGVGAVAGLDFALGDDCDLGIAARQYGVSFDNPFARSVAEPDTWEGARARNERGAEVSTSIAVGSFLRVASSLDMWSALTAPSVWNARARARTTWKLTSRESLALEGEGVDKDVRYGGDYAETSCAAGEDNCARGARATGTVRAVTERVWHTRVAVAVRHTRQDTAASVVQESRVTGHLTVKPWPGIAVAVVASERVSARAVEIDGAKRLVAVTAAIARAWLSVDAMFRSETRWDGSVDADRVVRSGALSLTVRL